MPEYIGPVEIPEITASGTFPVTLPWGAVRVLDPRIVVHPFGTGDIRVEQRFYVGPGQRRFTVNLTGITLDDRAALQTFFNDRKGSYQPFTLAVTDADGTQTNVIVRFASPGLSLSRIEEHLFTGGLEFVEEATAAPTYTSTSTLTRFPGSTLATALLGQAHEIVPVLEIVTADHTLRFSDRRMTLDSQLYQPRLLQFGGITQTIGGAADLASFTLGNADHVLADLVNAVDLDRARVLFAIYHVGTQTRVNLWSGHVADWRFDSGPEFHIDARDGVTELRLAYPRQKISRQAGFDVPNQPVNVGGKKGISRITATSVANDTAYGRPLKDVWVNDSTTPMPVECEVIAGRDESEFYAALGVIGRGPISGFGSNHTLDNQPNHGPGALGLRRSYGGNPSTGAITAIDNSPDAGSDSFALDAVGDPLPVKPLDGVAFLQIRRNDEKGIQPVRPQAHEMVAYVSGGLGGWVWSGAGPYTRTWTGSLTNPVWVAVNTYLHAVGSLYATQSAQEALFDVPAALAAATICDSTVAKLIGEGTETQFRFAGIVGREERPLADVLSDILSSCLGYWTNTAGKLRIGIRINSSTVEAFTAGNVIHGSLSLSARQPAYNDLTVSIADADYRYQQNTVSLADTDHIDRIGQTLKANVNLIGVTGKSQAARICTVALRESLGGITEAEQRAARRISFRTTILALNTEPGMVCSLTHELMPGGVGEFRVTGWRLNPDWSIDIEGETTTDSMYDLTTGPKPEDIQPEALPALSPADPLIVTRNTPVAPSGVTLAIHSNAGRYVADVEWTAPGTPLGTIGYAVELRFAVDSGGTTIETEWSARNLIDGVAEEQHLYAPQGSPDAVRYAKARVAGRNVVGQLSAWVESPTWEEIEAATPGSIPAPDQPGSGDWSIALGPTQADAQTGEQYQRIDITITARPTGVEYWHVWVYEGASAPTDRAQWDSPFSQHITASGSTVIEFWKPRGLTNVTYQIAVTGNTSIVTVWPEPSVTPVKPVTVPAISASTVPTTWDITATSDELAGTLHGKYAITATLPTDENRDYWITERRWTQASWGTPKSDWFPFFSARTLPWEQSPHEWAWPEDEWLEIRFGTVNYAGQITWHGTIKQLHLSGGGFIKAGALDPDTVGEGAGIVNNKLETLRAGAGVSNGDLRAGLKDWTLDPASSWSIVTTDAYQGNALRGDGNGVGKSASTNLVPVIPGKAYLATAYARSTLSGGNGFWFIGWWNAAGGYVSATTWRDIIGDSYNPYRAIGVVPAGIAFARITFGVPPEATSGRMLIDNVSLIELEPTTGAVTRTSAGIDVAANGIDTARIANLAVSEAKIANAAVATSKIQDLSVITDKLAPSAVNTSKLADLAVEAAKLGNSSVTATKIANLAVGSAAIQAAAVGEIHIANAAVTNAKIANAAISTAKIDNLAVTENLIANGAITTPKLTTSELLVGAGGGKPVRLRINDAFGNMIAFLGDNQDGFVGGWFQRARIGGTYGSPVIDANSLGMSITNAALAVNGSGFNAAVNTAEGVKVTSTGTFAGAVMQMKSHELVSDYALGAAYRLKAWAQSAELTHNGWMQARLQNNGPGGSLLLNYDSATDYLYIQAQSGQHRIFTSRPGSYIHFSGLNSYADFRDYRQNGAIRLDASGNMRWPNVYTENNPLAGLTATHWVPAYDASGNYRGKILIIP